MDEARLKATLRELLEAASDGMPKEQRDRLVEECLSGLLKPRYAAEDVSLSDASKDKARATLLEKVRERRAKEAETHPNGVIRHALGRVARPRSPFQRRWKLGLGLAAAVAVAALYLSFFGAPWSKREIIVDQTPPKAPTTGPQTAPEVVPDPVPKSVREPSVWVRQKPAPLSPRTSPQEPSPRDEPWRHETYVGQQIDIGRFTAVMGEPKVRRLGTPYDSNVLPNQRLIAGVCIETGDADQAQIRFNDGTTVSLSFNSAVEIPHFKAAGSFRPERPLEIRLSKGQVWANVVRAVEQERFAVVTPIATAEALGTEFGLKLRRAPLSKPFDAHRQAPENSLEAVLTVKSGTVRFSNGNGNVSATAMTESLARAGSAPTEPMRLRVLKRVYKSQGGVQMFETQRETLSWNIWGLPFGQGWTGVWLDDCPKSLLKADFRTEPGSDPKAPWNETAVRVNTVDRGSSAASAGVRVGDVVTAVDGRPVKTAAEALCLMLERPGRSVTLDLVRAEAAFRSSVNVEPWSSTRLLPPRGSQRLYEATRLLLMGDGAQAVERLTSLQEGPDAAAANQALGVIVLTKDRMGPAIRHFQEAVKRSPDVAAYHLYLGRALVLIGNFGRALEEYQAAFDIDPDAFDALNPLITVLKLLDRQTEAVEVSERYVRAHPEIAGGWAEHARVLCDVGRLQEAMQCAQRAVGLEPESHYAWETMGSVCIASAEMLKAGEALERAVALDSTCVPGLWACSSVLTRLGRSGESENLLRAALGIDPGHGHVAARLSDILAKKGKRAEAEAVLRRAIAAAPDDPTATWILAGLIKDERRFGEAEALVRSALARHGESREGLVALAEVHAVMGKTDEAEKTYRRAVDIAMYEGDPRVVARAHLSFGRWAESAGLLDLAEKCFLKAIDCDPLFGDSHRDLAIYYYESRRDPKRAEQAIRRAIEVDPIQSDSHQVLGVIARESGRLDEAERHNREAIRLFPAATAAHVGLGMVHVERGQVEEAEREYRAALNLEPENTQAIAQFGILRSSAGKLEEALPYFQKWRDLEPKNPSPYSWLSDSYMRMRRFSEAEDIARKWLKLAPEHSIPYRQLAVAIVEQNNKSEEALALARKSVELAEDEAARGNSFSALGLVHLRRGELDSAENWIWKALAIQKLFARWRNLGRTLELKGQKQEALEAYKKALNLNPNDKEAKEGLARLSGPEKPPSTSSTEGSAAASRS